MKQDFSLVAAVVSRNKSPPWLLRLLSRVDEHLNCWLDDKYDPQLFMEMLEPAIGLQIFCVECRTNVEVKNQSEDPTFNASL